MTKIYPFELNDSIRERLQPLADDWQDWLGGETDSQIAMQLAAYQSLLIAFADNTDDTDKVERILEMLLNDPRMEKRDDIKSK